MAALLLLRHGQSTWNAEHRWQGWADPPLSPLGEAQAHAAADALADTGLQGVVSSDLRRARHTAEIIANDLGLGRVEVEVGLRERDVGDWCGLTAVQIDDRWPDALVAWRRGELACPPGGEADTTMAERALEVLHRLAERPEAALLVVTHGGLIRLLVRRLGLEPQPTPNLSGRWFHGRDSTITPGDVLVIPSLEPSADPGGQRAPDTVATVE